MARSTKGKVQHLSRARDANIGWVEPIEHKGWPKRALIRIEGLQANDARRMCLSLSLGFFSTQTRSIRLRASTIQPPAAAILPLSHQSPIVKLLSILWSFENLESRVCLSSFSVIHCPRHDLGLSLSVVFFPGERLAFSRPFLEPWGWVLSICLSRFWFLDFFVNFFSLIM